MARYSFEDIKSVALKYDSIKEFSANDINAYNTAVRNKWLYSFTWLKRKKPLAKRNLKPVHTYDEIKAVAMHFQTRTEFARAYNTLYAYANSHKWLDSFDWMNPKVKSHISDDEIREIANNYGNIEDFRKFNANTYSISRKRNIRFPHMAISAMIDKPSKEKCAETKNKYINLAHFISSDNLYYVYSLYQGWIDEWFDNEGSHIQPISKEECYKIALKYKSRTEFSNMSQPFFQYAKKNGWLDEWFGNKRGLKAYTHNFLIIEEVGQIPESIDINNIYYVHCPKNKNLPVMTIYTECMNYDRDSIRYAYKKKTGIPLKDISVCSKAYFEKKYK